MSIIDPSKVIMAVPEYKMDQIVGIATGSLAVATNGGGTNQTSSTTVDTKLKDKVYFAGLWSIDGGTTWFDMNSLYFNGVDATTGQLTLQLSAYISPAGLLTITATNSTKTTYTAQFKLVLLARIDGGTLSPSGTAQPLNYNSKLNYMKIFKADVVKVAVNGSVVINHNLGYIPNVACWNSADDAAIGDNLGITNTTPPDVIVDSNNLTIQNPSGLAARNFHYIIYLDK